MAKKQHIKTKVKQPLLKRTHAWLKVILIILLITGILSFLKSCTDNGPEIPLPGGWLGDVLEKLADALPFGFINLTKPGDFGDKDTNRPPNGPDGDVNEDKEGVEEGGEGDDPDEGNGENKHTCNVGYDIIEAVEATCTSPGLKKHFKCLGCGILFDFKTKKEVTAEELIIPINKTNHSVDTDYVQNHASTHNELCTREGCGEAKRTYVTCTYGDDWSYGDNSGTHYHECVCGRQTDNEKHYDYDLNSVCDVCGYTVLNGDGDGEGEIGNDCEHNDSNDDGFCDSCGKPALDGDENENPGENGGDNGEDGENPTPDESCQHEDKNDDNVCDKCGEAFSDGDENENLDETCQHEDRDDNNKCDKCDEPFSDGECEHSYLSSGFCAYCKKDKNGFTINEYDRVPGSSSNPYIADHVDTIVYEVSGKTETFEIWETKVDINVLYWNDAFYSNECLVEMDGAFNIIPSKVTADHGLYKVRIVFASLFDYERYALKLVSSNANHFEYNKDELYVDIFYFDESIVHDDYKFDIISLSDGSSVPKQAVASIDVYTLKKKDK